MERNYLNTLRSVLDNGVWQKNERTGVTCCSLDGAITRFDLSKAFTAAVTTKKLAWDNVRGEFCGFLRGVTSAADFRALGCKVWDANANDNEAWLKNAFREGPDHLGDVYGAMWRRWPAYIKADCVVNSAQRDQLLANGWRESLDIDDDNLAGYEKEIDQLGECIRKLILNPSDRRILFHAWNPALLDTIALPACHLLYQFLPNVQDRILNMTIYIRSWDTFLGGPFNIAEGGLMIHLIARLTGFTPGRLTVFSGDTHIYENHLNQVEEQLTREPYPAPKLIISGEVPTYDDFLDQSVISGMDHPRLPKSGWTAQEFAVEEAIDWLSKVEPHHFTLEGYQHHPALSAPMAV